MIEHEPTLPRGPNAHSTHLTRPTHILRLHKKPPLVLLWSERERADAVRLAWTTRIPDGNGNGLTRAAVLGVWMSGVILYVLLLLLLEMMILMFLTSSGDESVLF
jgi:hypothetical protein